jgi:tryptophan synthase alpha chain
VKGVTGAANIDTQDVASMVARIRKRTQVPVGVGFGIRDPATAKRVGRVADAVVIGSRIVQAIADAPPNQAAERAGKVLAEFHKALDPRPEPANAGAGNSK